MLSLSPIAYSVEMEINLPLLAMIGHAEYGTQQLDHFLHPSKVIEMQFFASTFLDSAKNS